MGGKASAFDPKKKEREGSSVGSCQDSPSSPSLTALKQDLKDLQTHMGHSLEGMKSWLGQCIQTSVAGTANAIVRALQEENRQVPSYEHVPSARLLVDLQTWEVTHQRFRSEEQALALSRVLEGKDHQLVVLPTGEGKSLLWLLPATKSWVGKVVIAVIPFVALRLDLEERCRQKAIPHSHWPPKKGQRPANQGVVFTSVEQATSVEFASFALDLHARKLLACIVLDECHLVLSANNYRTRVSDLKDLFTFGVPVLCTTATLPPHLVPRFKEVLDVQHVQVTRRGNDYSRLRINIRVQKNRVERLEAVVNEVMEWIPHLERMSGSALVICRTKDDCEEVAGRLGFRPYHGQLSHEAKAEIFNDFQALQQIVLVATTAVATGVHFDHACAVLMDGPPYDMLTFAQTVGRVGRNGKGAVCSLIADPSQRHQPNPHGEEDLLGQEALDRMAFERNVCRKLPLSAFVDGIVVSCLSNDVLCDVCQKTLESEGGVYTGLRDVGDLAR